MKPALVIGFGNPLRGDDGIGQALAAMVAARVAPDAAIVMAVHQLMPELADPIHAAGLVIFMDAAADGDPGSWGCEAISPASPVASTPGHHFSPDALLSFVRALYGDAPEACLVSVTGRSFDCSDSLTPEVEAVLPDVADFIVRKIKARRAGQMA